MKCHNLLRYEEKEIEKIYRVINVHMTTHERSKGEKLLCGKVKERQQKSEQNCKKSIGIDTNTDTNTWIGKND